MAKRKMGRPRIAEELKVKNNSRTMRVPLGILEALKAVAVAYKAGLISLDDIQNLAKKGTANVK